MPSRELSQAIGMALLVIANGCANKTTPDTATSGTPDVVIQVKGMH